MGKMPKIKKNKAESIIKKTLSSKKTVTDLVNDDCFKLSLRHIDKTQGQTWYQWQDSHILADAIETISIEQWSKSFTNYGDFPPKNKTEFTHPSHVPEDAQWARIHINGKQCLAGHVVNNTFYLVFLDENHRFWISDLKHT